MPQTTSTKNVERFWLAVLVCYGVFIFVGTHVPGSEAPVAETNGDKVLHFVAFAILAALLARYVHVKQIAFTWRTWAFLWLLVVFYGALDELSQIPVGRGCEFNDWLADAFGAAFGLAGYRYVVLRRREPLVASRG